jgi:hypothetical protein
LVMLRYRYYETHYRRYIITKIFMKLIKGAALTFMLITKINLRASKTKDQLRLQ